MYVLYKNSIILEINMWPILKILKLNNISLNNQWVKNEMIRYFELKSNENTTYQNLGM